MGEGRRNVLSGSRVVIGRSRECDIVLRTRTSRAGTPSCAAASAAGQVVDLGSTNGIKVNGRRVATPAEPGDQITIGVTDLTFELD